MRDRWGGRFGLSDDDEPKGCDLLFVSHLTATRQWSEGSTDTYFGTLPWQLQGLGHRVRIALIDHTSAPHTELVAPTREASTVPRTLLPRRMGRTDEAAIQRRLDTVADELVAGLDYVDLRRLAARQARQGASRQSLRIGLAIARLVARHRPKALVFTYEGHAWERVAMYLSRQEVPGLRCIAVHHAILAPMQHAMTTRYGVQFDPDTVLAAGRAALEWLSNAPGLNGLPVDLLGSPRARPDAPVPKEPKDGNNCLFLPEGMVSESTRLAHAAYDLAAARPDLTCTIRLHPLTSRTALAAIDQRFVEAPSNVDWSPPGRTLDEDGHRATWAVYRGSSAVLSAMICGAVPVYLGDEPDELRIDPLRGAGGTVKIVKDPGQLAPALNVEAITVDALQKYWAYAQDYYTPMDPSVILRHTVERSIRTDV